MFGLVVLFLLGLWLAVIVLSVWLPYRLLRGRGRGRGIAIAGALFGFTLSFAGWLAKWRLEHWLVQRDLTEARQQDGGCVCRTEAVETDGKRGRGLEEAGA